jgi:hypothetical protein
VSYPSTSAGLFTLVPLKDQLAQSILTEAHVLRILALEPSRATEFCGCSTLRECVFLRVGELCWKDAQERDESGQLTVFGKGSKTPFSGIRVISVPAHVLAYISASASEVPIESRKVASRLSARERRSYSCQLHQGRLVEPPRLCAHVTSNDIPPRKWQRFTLRARRTARSDSEIAIL